MNDQLQAALAHVIGKTISGIDASVTFLQAQLPEVVQQLLLWKLVASALLFLLAVAMLLAAGTLATMAYRAATPRGYPELKRTRAAAWRAYQDCSSASENWTKIKDAYYEADAALDAARPNHDKAFVCVIAAFALTVFSAFPMSFTWLQIWLAPKVYLIEYAARLAK